MIGIKNPSSPLSRKTILGHARAIIGGPRTDHEVTIPVGKSLSFKLKVAPPDFISTLLKEGIDYEPDVSALMEMVIQSDSHTIVVGAHIGYHAIRAAVLASDGHVTCFEPHEETVQLLRENSASYSNITVNAIALNDGSQDTVSFKQFSLPYSAWSTTTGSRLPRVLDKLAKPKMTKVPAASLDGYIQKASAQPPDLLLIDTENAEMNILQGGKNTIQKHKPMIIIEVGDQGRTSENSSAAILRFLENLGYKFFWYDTKSQQLRKHQISQSKYGYVNLLCIHEDKLDLLKQTVS